MKRFVIFCWLAAGSITALTLFQIKQEVRSLEQEIAETQSRILQDQEAVHILEAEWSYLNNPARISTLAERHLKMVPLPAERIISFAELPLPGVPEGEEAMPQDGAPGRPSAATLVKVPAGETEGLRR